LLEEEIASLKARYLAIVRDNTKAANGGAS
jgi:hypothetical protein